MIYNKTLLINITPELPPTIGGVSDYTSILTKRLIEVSDGAVQPSMILAGWRTSDEGPDVDFPVEDLAGECSADELAKTIQKLASHSENKPIVLLQYSGYGYAKRGAPLWLLRGLQKVCGKEGIPLVIMFHELFATGKPWSSTFWMSPLQRYVASQLAKLSSANVTNREHSATWLQNHIESKETVSVQPVFSNVGEPENVSSYSDRKPYAVVFGGIGMKQRLFENWNSDMDQFLHKHRIEKIVDVGQSNNEFNYSEQFPVEKLGIQSEKLISDLLMQSKVGLIDLRLNCLTKSGVFSAYCAYGVAPLVRSEFENSGSLKEGVHFIRYINSNIKLDSKLETIGKNGFDWYQEIAHSKKVAEEISMILRI